MEHAFTLIQEGLDHPCTERVLEKGCARLVLGSLLDVISDPSCS
jgi:hypothetical protein